MVKRPNRVNLSIPRELINKARAKAIAQGSNLSRVVISFLEAWVVNEIDLPTLKEDATKQE